MAAVESSTPSNGALRKFLEFSTMRVSNKHAPDTLHINCCSAVLLMLLFTYLIPAGRRHWKKTVPRINQGEVANGLTQILLAGAFALTLVTYSLPADARDMLGFHNETHTLRDLTSSFAGHIEINAKDSIPDWSEGKTAPLSSPDMLIIMLDDVGFADTSTFGGIAETPVLDRLAANGLRYNRFHTAAICAPTRAALLSGRNQHRIGFGAFGGIGFPGYDGIWKKNAISIAEVLKRNGYSTAAFGKWHNTPLYEITPIGPFDRWPTGLGFDYFFGNMLGNGSQWDPILWRNTERVSSRHTEAAVHLTTRLVDDAIRWVHTHNSLAPRKPYFIYFAPEAAHTPHHVPKEWIDKYHGKFDQGWDRLREQIFARQKAMGIVPTNADLTPRPKELPSWESLAPDQRRLLARQMEVFAAFIAHTDHEIGRLIQTIKEGPKADNTMILFIVGDNGDEAGGGINGMDELPTHYYPNRHQPLEGQLARMDELGGPALFNLYSAGWAWMGSTPFQWVKDMASHFGGTRNPLIVTWPARIGSLDRGGVRSQFAYVTDIAPTLYEAAGIVFPEVHDGIRQLPLDGNSLVSSFTRADAPSLHRVQYFESEGNRAIYQDGWMASARHFIFWLPTEEYTAGGVSNGDFTRDAWELYHVDEDFTQAHDLSAQYPRKLIELRELFDVEARRNNVYPLGAGSQYRAPPWIDDERKKFVFYSDFPSTSRTIPRFSQLRRLSADVVIPAEGASGVIAAIFGGFHGRGMVMYIKDGHLVYECNALGTARGTLTSRLRVPHGRVKLTVELASPVPGHSMQTAKLFVNQEEVGAAQVPRSFEGISFEVQANSDGAISRSYSNPFTFSGAINHVTVELF